MQLRGVLERRGCPDRFPTLSTPRALSVGIWRSWSVFKTALAIQLCHEIYRFRTVRDLSSIGETIFLTKQARRRTLTLEIASSSNPANSAYNLSVFERAKIEGCASSMFAKTRD